MSAPSLIQRTRNSLWAGSLLVGLLVASIVYIGLDSRRKIEGIMQDTKIASLLHRMESDLHTLREHELGFFVEISDPAARGREQGKWAAARDDLGNAMNELRSIDAGAGADSGLGAILDASSAFSKQYGATFERVSSDALRHPALDAMAIAEFEHQMGAVQARASEVIDMIGNQIAVQEAENVRNERRIERELIIEVTVSLILGAIVVLMLLALLTFVPARLASALKGLTRTIDEVSLGQRHDPVATSGIADFHAIEQAVERLRISVNGMLQRLMPKTR
jgi:HAMP domain-containing protein